MRSEVSRNRIGAEYGKNLFELWNDKELPEEIQKEVDGFANAKYATNAEKIFRAGFIIGLNNNRYKKIMGIEE
jgi:hypothetical protein